MQAVDLGFSANNMTKPKNQLFCRLDGLTPSTRSEQRLETLHKLGLLVSEAVPVFEEATQKASTFSGAPIGILGLAVAEELWFKSAVGLSTIGLTDRLAARRKIPLHESFSIYAIDSQQPLIIDNTLSNAVFADSILTQHYGIRSYLGVPIISSSGVCIGVLEVMDWAERKFNARDVDHLTLLAQWCLGEFERDRLGKTQSNSAIDVIERPEWLSASSTNSTLAFGVNSTAVESTFPNQLSTIEKTEQIESSTTAHPIKIKLLSQLTQELKTPLTSVIGMASVLHQEVYGPLSEKQREYLEIIHNSGQNLITLVDEIVSLGVISDRASEINLAAVDIEMLCQQVVNSLTDIAKQQAQELCLSVEPGNRIWFLDKEKIRQAVYYMIVSVLEMSEPGGEVKIHVSKRDRVLNIAIGVSHPWLGENFANTKVHSQTITQALNLNRNIRGDRYSFNPNSNDLAPTNRQVLTASALMKAIDEEDTLDKNTNKIPRDILGLLFCCHLTELHQGRVIVQGSANFGYRYLLQFPHTKSGDE